VGCALPDGFASRETDGAMFLGNDLRHELRESLHLGWVRVDAKCDVELLEACDRQDALPNELGERLLGLVVIDQRKICLHFADEDRVRLNPAVLKLPLVECELPIRLLDDDATCPRAWIVGASLGEEVAEEVLEHALSEPQLADAPALGAG